MRSSLRQRVISVRPRAKRVKQQPSLPLQVELAEGVDLARRIRDRLIAGGAVILMPQAGPPRRDYGLKRVDRSQAT